MTSVACIGDIALDFYVELSRKQVGGISFNVAWNLRQLGVDAHVFSLIGNDTDGVALLKAISQRGFSTDAVMIRDGLTAEQRITVNCHGERIFDGYRTGVLSSLCLSDLPLTRLAHFDALHIPLSDGLESLFDSVARQAIGVTKIADLSIDGPNPEGLRSSVERYAPFFDLLFIGGKSELIPFVANLAGAYPDKVLILTLGSKGAIGFRGRAVYEEAAIPLTQIVDTTGCGDGFQAAFIARWLDDTDDIPRALKAGVEQGAKIASHLGATDCVVEHK